MPETFTELMEKVAARGVSLTPQAITLVSDHVVDQLLAALPKAVSQELMTVPKELKDVLQPGRVYFISLSSLLNNPVNYLNLKFTTEDDGIWMVFEMNSYRVWEFKFHYSDEYRYPRNPNRHAFQDNGRNGKCKVCGEYNHA